MPGAGRPRTTRTELAEAALRIIDAEGVDALTMRRLADEVGIGTMTAYGHFASKDELVDAAIDAASAPVRLELRGTWREQLETLALAGLTSLERHPAIVEVRLRRPVVRPDALRFGEAGMRVLQEAGLAPARAAELFRLVFTYVVGFAALSPEHRRDEARAQTAAAVAALDADSFPHLTAARDEFAAAAAGRDVFRAGLACLLDGIAVQVAAAAGDVEP